MFSGTLKGNSRRSADYGAIVGLAKQLHSTSEISRGLMKFFINLKDDEAIDAHCTTRKIVHVIVTGCGFEQRKASLSVISSVIGSFLVAITVNKSV